MVRLPRRRKVGQGRLGDRWPTVMCATPADDRLQFT